MVGIFVNSLVGDGAERIALTLAKEYRDIGVDVVLICIEKEKGYEVPEGMDIHFLTQFDQINGSLRKFIWVIICAFRLAKLSKKLNLVQVQAHITRAIFINTLSRSFGAVHKTQIVSHLPVSFEEENFVTAAIKKVIYRFFYSKADDIVSISEVMRRVINKSLDLDSNTHHHRVIFNPHEVERIKKLSTASDDTFTFDDKKKYLVMAGRLVNHKHPINGVEVLDLVRKVREDVELIILGVGPETDRVKELVSKKNLEPYVHVLGYQSNPFPFIRKSDLFLLCSEREGLPNIIIESMICGTPVISTDCISGPREILSPATDPGIQITDNVEYAPYGVLVPVLKPELMTAAILKMLANEEVYKKYVAASATRLRDFDKRRIAEIYLNGQPIN